MRKTYQVYLITNNVNEKRYVGWTYVTISRRWKTHLRLAALTNPKQMPLLHKAIRKYGKDAFTIKLLCEVSDEKTAREKEVHFIEKYRTFYKWDDEHGYNMTLGGEGAVGYRHTTENLKKMSERARELWDDKEWAAAWRKRHKENPPIQRGTKRPDFAAKIRGRKRPGMHSEETKQHLAGLNSHTFLVILPTGGRKIIKNLTKYCRDHQLNRGHMHSCSRGELRSYKGHFVYSLERLRLSQADALEMDFDSLEVLRRPEKYAMDPKTGMLVPKQIQAVARRQFIATGPDGHEHAVRDLEQFCKERDLSYRSMYRLARGGRRGLRSGWQCRYADGPVREWKPKVRTTGCRCPAFQMLSKRQQDALTSKGSLQEMYLEEGLSVQAIADRFGVGRWFVRSQIAKHKITLRERTRTSTKRRTKRD